MRLILATPDLLAQGAEALTRSPALARLAGYAGSPRTRRGGLDAWLAGDTDDVDSSAPFAALGAGFDPGASWVLRADPVSLVAGHLDVTLAARIDDLNADDAAALLATLNAHFGRDGLKFHAPRPDAWFAALDTAPALATTPLSAVRGPIHPHLPHGNDAGKWRRWMSEMQMLLHEHPVNAARTGRGCAAVTGIWIADGGSLQQHRAAPAASIAASPGRAGDVARGLARVHGIAVRESPPGLSALPSAAEALVVLGPAVVADTARLESAWLRPAVVALERGELASLRLLADGTGLAAAWEAPQPTWLARARAKFSTRPFAPPAYDPDAE